MTLIAIDELEAGMTVAQNVVNQRGQVLLPKDTELNDKHIQGLRSWSIRFVDVANSRESAVLQLSEAQQNQLDNIINRVFSQQDDNTVTALRRDLYENYLYSLVLELDTFMGKSDIPEPEPADKSISSSQLIQNVKTLTTIPQIKQRLNTEMNRPDVSVSQIGELLARDPVLSALIIKMSNSAWYGAGRRTTTVSRAVTVMGYEDVRKFVSDVSTTSEFENVSQSCATPHSFWLHSVATSVFTQYIAEQINHPDVEYLAMLGLLHDIGKQLLYVKMPEKYSSICKYAWQTSNPTLKLERKYLGFYHNTLTLELLRHWNFSKTTQEIIHFHHSPEKATHKKEAYILHLADALANALGFGVQKICVHPEVDANVLREIQLKEKFLPGIVALAQQRIYTIKHELQIP